MKSVKKRPVGLRALLKQKKYAAALICSVLVVIIVLAAAMVLIPGPLERTLRDAEALLGRGRYVEALEVLDRLESPLKTRETREAVLAAMEADVRDAIDREAFSEAAELLETYRCLPNIKSLERELAGAQAMALGRKGRYAQALELLEAAGATEAVPALLGLVQADALGRMNRGDYREARQLLLDFPQVPGSRGLLEQIKWETLLLFCLGQLPIEEPRLEHGAFYEGTPYPYGVLEVTDPTGLHHFCLYDALDLSLAGISPSPDPGQVPEDSFDQWLVADGIAAVSALPPETVSYDPERVAALLGTETDPTPYALP